MRLSVGFCLTILTIDIDIETWKDDENEYQQVDSRPVCSS